MLPPNPRPTHAPPSPTVRIITVHGRTKEQKGRAVSDCNWDAIRRIKTALPVPVFSNGAISSLEDVER